MEIPNTVDSHYNMVKYNMILHTSIQWLGQNTYESVNSQNIPKKFQWNKSHIMKFLIQENAFENVCAKCPPFHRFQMVSSSKLA